MAETVNPIEEIQTAMDIIRPVLEHFDKINDIYHPIDNTTKGNKDL